MLKGYYEAIPEVEAQSGDILVWQGGDANEVIHSAVLTNAFVAAGSNYLDGTSRLQTKNGILPETSMSLMQLIDDFYGESYTVYRQAARSVVEEGSHE